MNTKMNNTIEKINEDNNYFTVGYISNYLSGVKVEVEFSEDYPLINKIIEDILTELLEDLFDDNINNLQSYDKYINICARLYKLSEGLNAFCDHTNEGSIITQNISLLNMVKTKITNILYDFPSNVIDDVEESATYKRTCKMCGKGLCIGYHSS